MTTNTATARLAADEEQGHSILLQIEVRDLEVLDELLRRPTVESRNLYALNALRVGVLALRTAGGQLDAGAIREAGARLLSEMKEILSAKSAEITSGLGNSLTSYLDPSTGLLAQRLETLLKRDGELDRMLSQHLAPSGSTLATALACHIGEQSPIFKMLSPMEANGLRTQLAQTLQRALEEQRKVVLREFSLDDKASALSRLVSEIQESQTGFTAEVGAQVKSVIQEFSLDRADSALSRLVQRVESAQKVISEQFSTDVTRRLD